MQDTSSFWAEIKLYEERLSREPDSLLFARLAEIYLKVGLLDDALHTARLGAAKHPAFVAGQRALARACQAKGLDDECLQALERVVAATPDDADAQKILGRLLTARGDVEAARTAFTTALDFNPDDVESRVELEALNRSAGSAAEPESDEIIEDIEILEVDEADLIEEDGEEEPAPETAAPESYEPLATATLAELYVQQGHTDKALDILKTILAADPANARIQSRIAELEAPPVPVEPAVSSADELLPGGAEFAFQDEPPVLQEPVQPMPEVPTSGSADNALATLEGWLESIGRIKACR